MKHELDIFITYIYINIDDYNIYIYTYDQK